MAVLVFLAALGIYVAGLAPEVYWLDSSELAAAAWGLGIAHPPGHPLAALLGKACALVPLGPIALRVGLASSLCGALAAVQCARLGRMVARRARDAREPAPSDALLGAAAGLLFAFCYAHAFQSVRPEVYALSSLLVLTAVHDLSLFSETHDRRRLYTAALFAGLALGNHHLLALAALLPAGVIAMVRGDGVNTSTRARGGWKVAAARVVGAGTLALAVWVYLPLRALAHPLINWGAPSTLARFWWTITAQAFQKSVARGATSDVPGVGFALASELQLAGALLALAGAYLLMRRRPTRRLGLMLLAAALTEAAAPALVGFDPHNPDAFGYLASSVALLAALAVALPSLVLARFSSEPARRLAAGALTLAAAGTLLLVWPRVTLASRHAASQTFAHLFERAAPRAPIITSYYQTIFGLSSLRVLEGARPDVDLIHRHFLAYPGYRDELVRALPARAAWLGDSNVVVPAPAVEPAPLIEYDLDLPAALVPLSVTVDARGELDEPQARRFAAWQRFLAAQRACALPDAAARAPAIAEARALIGADPTLAALAAACLPPEK